MSEQKIYFTIIFMLMLTTGLIIYFMYLKTLDPFFFETTAPALASSGPAGPLGLIANNTQPNTQVPNVTSLNIIPISPTSNDGSTITTIPYCIQPEDPSNYKSVMSRYFGVGFNITYVQQNNNDYYLINHIPTISTGTLGGCYSITSDNLLTIKVQNTEDTAQLWSLSQHVDSISSYYSITPLNNNNFALQYENGSLSLRPFNSASIFEGQKWLRNTDIITRGIPVLNNNPASLFTSEFDPYSSSQQSSSNTMTDQNSKQVNDVITAVKSGIQQYLGQLDNNNQTSQVSSSSLGQKASPLNINLSLSSPAKQVSAFANVDNASLSNNMLSIMDKYGPSTNSSGGKNVPLYNSNNLQNEINQFQGCKLVNINDYTSNRVSSCNCKL